MALIGASVLTEGATLVPGEIIYNIGSGMDDVSIGLNISADVSEKKYGQAATRLAAFGLGKAADNIIDKKVTDRVSAGILKYRSDGAIGAVKDKIVDNIDRKQEKK